MTDPRSFQVMPPLAEDDLASLRASIAEHGVQVAIVVDENDDILDGHHRYQIATELGIQCPKIVKLSLSDHEKRLLSVTLNLARRHLTDAQKAMLGRQIEPDVAERARQRQVDLGKLKGGRPSVTSVTEGRGSTEDEDANGTGEKPVTHVAPFVEDRTQDESRMRTPTSADVKRTTDEVARTVGLGSGRTYERAKQLIAAAEEHAPEIMPHVEAGAIDLPEVRRTLKKKLPVTRNALHREFLVAGQDAVENASQESLDAWTEMSIRDDALPVTAHLLGQAAAAITRANVSMTEMQPHLLEQLVQQQPKERERVEMLIKLQGDMTSILRTALGTKTSIRRIS